MTTGQDTRAATAARIYDYLLGGNHNFDADRKAAEALMAAVPFARDMAVANRRFLRRAVRTLAQHGIRQFLDLGSGIPTAGNVDEVAREVITDPRVIYVDIDPVAVMAANQMLVDNPRVHAVEGDLRRPDELLTRLARPATADIIDFAQPVALLYLSVLQMVPGDDAYEVVGRIRDRLAPGSAIAISHVVTDRFETHDPDKVQDGLDVYKQRTTTPVEMRTKEQLATLFGAYSLIDPGITWISAWRPDPTTPDAFTQRPEDSTMMAGVAIHTP